MPSRIMIFSASTHSVTSTFRNPSQLHKNLGIFSYVMYLSRKATEGRDMMVNREAFQSASSTCNFQLHFTDKEGTPREHCKQISEISKQVLRLIFLL